MKNLNLIYYIFICSLSSTINAQDKDRYNLQYTFAKFEIRDGRKNGDDITPILLQEKACLLMYKTSDSEQIMLSNFWEESNSQSYGPIYFISKEENPNKEGNYKNDLFHFYWSYINTYDKKEGTAMVNLLIVQKPLGNYFELTILPENLDKLEYQGKLMSDYLVLDFNMKK